MPPSTEVLLFSLVQTHAKIEDVKSQSLCLAGDLQIIPAPPKLQLEEWKVGSVTKIFFPPTV